MLLVCFAPNGIHRSPMKPRHNATWKRVMYRRRAFIYECTENVQKMCVCVCVCARIYTYTGIYDIKQVYPENGSSVRNVKQHEEKPAYLAARRSEIFQGESGIKEGARKSRRAGGGGIKWLNEPRSKGTQWKYLSMIEARKRRGEVGRYLDCRREKIKSGYSPPPLARRDKGRVYFSRRGHGRPRRGLRLNIWRTWRESVPRKMPVLARRRDVQFSIPMTLPSQLPGASRKWSWRPSGTATPPGTLLSPYEKRKSWKRYEGTDVRRSRPRRPKCDRGILISVAAVASDIRVEIKRKGIFAFEDPNENASRIERVRD